MKRRGIKNGGDVSDRLVETDMETLNVKQIDIGDHQIKCWGPRVHWVTNDQVDDRPRRKIPISPSIQSSPVSSKSK